MTIEVERKFIAPELPTRVQLGEGVQLRQGYLAEEDRTEVRVRITPASATLAVKAGTGLSRTEVEVAITLEQAEALWPHTVGRRIDKIRHRVPVDDLRENIAEVDVYAGSLTGLYVVEVEFDSEADAAAFDPPDWFGREVTGDSAWSNAALARNGRPG